MTWLETLIVALSTYGFTKIVDFGISILMEKREFKKHRKEKIYADIEVIKNEVGVLLELAASWQLYKEKQQSYLEFFANDYQLIGKFNKYPSVANAARDVMHWCKIVAHDEKEHTDQLHENKKELHEKYKLFLNACEAYVNNLV